jgi:hypothetical protein
VKFNFLVSDLEEYDNKHGKKNAACRVIKRYITLQNYEHREELLTYLDETYIENGSQAFTL